MLLSALLSEIDPIRVDGPVDRVVQSVDHDSRRVAADGVFVAIRGEKVDGRSFVPDIAAAAVIVDGPVRAPPGVTVIQVEDARLALAQAAAALHDHPGRRIPVVGVTGTNGKTTVTWMIEAIAAGAGLTACVIGTTGHRIAGERVPTTHTTPEAPVVQALLGKAADRGCALAAMEVSSIGLALRRVDAIPFRVAIFTTFGHDHLDFHGTPTAYLDAKLRLFTELLAEDGTAILSATVPEIAALEPRGARTWRYGVDVEGVDISATGLAADIDGTTATVHTPRGVGVLRVPMVGRHNVENALAALGAALALDLPLDAALAGLAAMPPVPGRLEAVPGGSDVRVLVDYAHTPDALLAVLQTLRPLTAGALHTVFGCGGDRDRAKRPVMGRIAADWSDHVVVTSDNPRSEDPLAIIGQVLGGVPADATHVHAVSDRAEAIQAAVAAARPGDVVLVAGKGHETTQTIGTEVRAFDDRAVAADALAGRPTRSAP